MSDYQVPLGFGTRPLTAVCTLMVLGALSLVAVGRPALAPAAAAGIALALGGGMLWGQHRLRSDVARLLTRWDDAVDDVELDEGGFVPRWEVQVEDRTVALTGTAFGPENPLFLEDEDGLHRL
ncbi:hypothetical protein HWV23_11300 [Natronomonas halophila]|uniref:hypothetical protein n=1 Tax=Natronomonas halophila TaxID=2747817 RepID=UPI0015B554B9|nr:hypothetical protein [Natronomonas halophila]QLD86283.1 hypothetical protein HWV23_11300 [Natronomonas halophila]